MWSFRRLSIRHQELPEPIHDGFPLITSGCRFESCELTNAVGNSSNRISDHPPEVGVKATHQIQRHPSALDLSLGPNCSKKL
jgi:hypothetical protein